MVVEMSVGRKWWMFNGDHYPSNGKKRTIYKCMFKKERMVKGGDGNKEERMLWGVCACLGA